MPELTGPKLDYTSTIQASGVTDEHKAIAQQLSSRHGKVRIAREASGIHCYMASPIGLEKDGRVELHKMHLAVNLDKYLNGEDLAGYCMKYSKPYRVSKLLKWKTLEERDIPNVTPSVFEKDVTEYLEDDGKGNMIPRSPGKCVPIISLPSDHPCIRYVESRGYDVYSLWEQFSCAYCDKERSDSKWRELPGGLRATPQGRLVFYIKQFGVQVGWQARLLEMVDGDTKYLWHPYKHKWVAAWKKSPEGAWQAMEWCMQAGTTKFDPSKYILGQGVKRNNCLMGLDAAISFNSDKSEKWCVLTEGPLDAARFGPPALAMMGKFFAQSQAQLAADHFDRVIFIPDNDVAGATGTKKVVQQLAEFPRIRLDVCPLPSHVKDAGELTTEEAKAFLEKCLNIKY